MPLRDHFRDPVNRRHSWDALHGGWPAMMATQLHEVLPPNFAPGPRVYLGTCTQPTRNVEADLPDVDEYEVRVYDVDRDRRLVAAIELVSPSNKDRPETRRAFVAKCAALLQQHVSVTIVDVVTTRDFNLYVELLVFLGLTDSSLAPPTNIYTVACRGGMPRNRWLYEAWHRPLTVGQPLPMLPIWLADDLAVTLDLEASYEDTCRVLKIA